jgi:hypothetical protein
MDAITGFIQAALAASLLAKGTVEGVKLAVNLPRWGPVLLAAIFAPLYEFLLLVSQKAHFTTDTVATGLLVAVIAWLLAIGVTMAQTKADKVEERVQTALDLPPGSTKEDVNAQLSQSEKVAK